MKLLISALTLALVAPLAASQGVFIDAERQLSARFGEAWTSQPQDTISAALVEMAESLPVSGAIDLPGGVPSGVLDFRRVADGVQITGGRDGRVIFGGDIATASAADPLSQTRQII